MISLRRLRLAIATAMIAALPSTALPANDGVPSEAYAEINAVLVRDHVLPRYQRLAVTTGAFAEATASFCSDPSQTGLDEMRMRFDGAMDAWMGAQHLRFGPVELFMRAHRLYFWPEARGRIDDAVGEVVAGATPETLATDRFPQVSVAAQGLPAAETFLYGNGALTADIQPDAIRCAVLTAITDNLRRIASDTAADWRGDRDGDAFVDTVTNPNPDNPYFQDHRQATLAFFQNLHDGLQLIADAKLKPVLGTSIEAARPRFAESRLSGRSARNIAINLEALQALYEGDGGTGLGTIVAKYGTDDKLDPLLRKAFRITLATARSIDIPLAEAVADPAQRPAVEKLQTQVLALKQIVKTRLAPALDVMVGFNALDGD